MKIAITAANGQLGGLVLTHLLNRAPAGDIVAITRKPFSVPEGVSNRIANYDDEESYVAALQGIETLLLISSSEIGRRIPQHLSVINAARRAGVKRIAYTSLLHADISTLSLAAEHKATEDALIASGVSYTILRNSWYIENHTMSVPAAVGAGAFIGSAGEGKISAAPRTDYAEAAAIVLSQAGHEGKTYELAGDVSFQLSELAAEVSRQVGKEIPYINLPEQEYAGKLLGFGLPPEIAQGVASWDYEASKGVLFDEGRQLSTLLGRPTGSLADAVALALKS
jgi:NAD(P)H dehydrogenase (quinone)